ncbi:mucin-binding protein [Limosilactobacillus fermentum]|uniref:mucin-binding protein n=1 Tax=Limosilactobacillus fermentum TaxID=1613 RepID=UPI003D76B241
MGEKKLHYKMYKDGKKFVFAAIATMSFFVFGGVSTVAVHADTTSGNLTAATAPTAGTTGTAGTAGTTGTAGTAGTTGTAGTAGTTGTAGTAGTTGTAGTAGTTGTAGTAGTTGTAGTAGTTGTAGTAGTTGTAGTAGTTGTAGTAGTTGTAGTAGTTGTAGTAGTTGTAGTAGTASDTNSFVQLMANNATSQTNGDGKTQYSSLNYAQNLSFESNSQDSNAPTATGVNLTGTYTQANLPQQFKNDGMTGDTFWLYSGADLLNSNVSITKNWANAGSINGRNVDFHETFHDFVAQNNPSTDGIWSITGVDTKNPYLILISSNAVDNIDVYNANFQETFWFTYSDDGSIVDITKFDQANAAQNNNQIFYFLSASLSSNNGVNSNRREYVQTNDAKTVIISKNPINDPSRGFTAPASTIGLTRVSGSNVPDGLVYTNTNPWGYQSPAGEDSNPDCYALQEGATFADFTSDKPTLYLGAVPINASSAPGWWSGSGSGSGWWHGNHNMNSDFLSFVTYSIVINKKVNETINYVDQNGKTIANSYTATPITFITVKAWDGTTTYYKFGSQENPTLDNAGKPDSSWIQADNAKFGAIDNPTVKGYKVISTTAPGSDLNSVAIQTVNNTSDDLNFTVVYAPAYSINEVKTVTETVHYIGQDGQPVANDASGIPTRFVTITNPIDGSTATYYSTTESGQPTLDNNGVPVGNWTRGNSTNFAAIINPNVIGQHVVSTTDPSNDLTQTTVKSIDSNSGNLDFTVTYTPNQEAANVTYIDDKTGKTLSTKDLTGDYGSTDPYRTGDTIADYEKQGYQLVSDNYPTNGVVYNQDGTVQKFEIHLTHGTTPVGPNNPQTPGEPINPDNPNGPKWPEGTDKSSLTQTVTRTVNYLDKQTGKVVAKQVTEQVTYNRTAIVDKVTGQIIGYSTTGGDTVDQTDGDKAWTAVDNKSDWDSVTSPDLSSKGYLAPDLATVAQQTVTPGDKDVTVNVYYDHDVVPVNPTNPQTPGTPINPDDPDSPKWPAGTDKDSLTTAVHQTIHYQYGDGSQAAPDKTDSTTFDHQVEIDKVTGEIVKDDGWTAENGKTSFDSKSSPVIPGYTASKPASDSVDGLTHDSKDNVQTITYTPNQEAANVTYIDDKTGKTLSTKDLTGDYGSTDPYRTGDTIADYEKQGYQLVSDNYPTNGVVYNQDGTVQKFEIHLTHGTTPVGPNNPQTPGEPINPDNPNGPKWPEGTDKSSLTQTVTRTVNYLDKQTGKVVAKQVTEQVTYNRTAIVDKVTGQIIGYSTTGGDTVDQTDGDKAWTAVDNKSDWDSVTSPDLSSKGYLAPDLATVAQQTVTPGDKDVTVNVYYDHDVVPVNPTNPQTPGTPINPDDPDSPKWPAGTDKDSLTTAVHQTIHYQYGDGSQAAPDKTDSTTFDHQVEIDKVTGEIVKDDGWTAENGKTSFDSKSSPVIPGYTASKPASDSVDGLTHDSKDNVQTITYTPNQEAANVTYIDDKTGKTLSTKDLTGDYGSTDPYRTGDTIADYEKQGYQLVSDNYPTNGVVYNQDGTVQKFEIHLTHGTTPVGPNNPQTPGEPINPDNPNGPKWPEGTDKSSLTQTVTRTVNYLDKQTGKVVAKQVTEQVTYNRTAIVDKVTGQIIGYSTTGGDTVDQTDGDKAWTAVDNKSDWDSVTSPDLSSKGYLAPDLATVAQQTVTPGDKDVTVNVYYDHDVVPVNPTNPQTPGTPINPDNPDGPKWPEGTDKSSLTQTVTRTVNYLDKQTGKVVAKQVTEQVTYNRTAIVDKVTGQIIGYSTTGGDTVDQTDGDKAWTAVDNKSDWDSVTSPDLSSKGYLAPDLATVAQQTVTPGDKDVTVNVYYDHDVVPVNPTNPQTPGTPINPDNPNGPKWPEGTDKSSLTQTVTRTVNYLDKQTGKVVAKQVTEQVTYNRTAIVDKVTGQIIGYSTTGGDTVDQTDGDKAWTAVDNKSDWDSVTSPDLSSKGYLAPDLATVAQQTVTPGDKDVTVNVYYDHDVVPVNPTNPQTPGTPINPDDPDSPKWPAGTDKDSLTTAVHQTIHYQYGDGSQAAPDKTDSTTFDHQVEIDKVTGEIVKDDGWTAENGKTSFDSKSSPVIPGYTASKPASDSVDGLTHDSKDNVQTITYTPNQEAANVTYIDDKTGKTLSTKDLTGDYGSTDPYRTGDTIADYEKQGYQLVSDNYPTNGVVYNQDGTVQKFEIHLTHGTTPVGPNNPQTPGEPINPDNPNGPKWPEGTDKSSLTQTVTRTVNYLDKQTGKVVAKQVTEQVTYNRTAIVDKVTGQIIGYSTTGGDTVDQTDGDKAWTAVDNKSDWDSVTSPDLSSKGYLAPDLATVAQQTVTPGDKDVTVNVYYDHDVVPVNPTNPQTPGTPINPDNPDGPKWPEGTDKSSLTQTVTRTVNYLDKQTGKVVAKQVN